jgi:cell division protease FtsH
VASIPESELPKDIGIFDSVEAAYSHELTGAQASIRRGLPVLIECDKELVAFFYRSLRERLRRDGHECMYLDGRVPANAGPMHPQGVIPNLLISIREAVRGSVKDRVLVLPHLDLLVTSSVGITSEAREVISLLYENPQILWIGFKDPSFSLPQVILNLFPHRESILGVGRDRLSHLITQRESRKFGRGLNPYQLYKYVSGVNAVRLRRLLSSVEGEDYPSDPEPAFAQLRASTIGSQLSLPDLDLQRDIGGYERVKKRLTDEILTILNKKDEAADSEQVEALESLIPRGMIFWGPPGTGKTLFAKAMASRLGAAVTVVSGPELKSRWVGESEERIRQVFVRARKSAPAVIVFDELDSFATARGTYASSGVEHSMVNQLLTEMDGFRSDELVFVVGTTNFVESLDPALLRPGRFEFQLEIPYPDGDDRRAIFEIYDRKLDLNMTERAIDYAVRRTMDPVDARGVHYTGDHIQALGRAIARRRVREGIKGETDIEHVEEAIVRYLDQPDLTEAEERVVATHEAGHAICALHCEHAPTIRRISIRGDIGGALGAVHYADPSHRFVVTRNELLDRICVLFGGREAESLYLSDISIGSSEDLSRATDIARALVCEYGLGDHEVGVQRIGDRGNRNELSDAAQTAIDGSIRRILDDARTRAHSLLKEHRESLLALRSLLLEKKVLDAESLEHMIKGGAQDG